MKELIMKLATASGPAGAEKHIREILTELLEPYVDRIETDVLGNLIARKKGATNNSKTVLLEANMDEPGIMSIHVDPQGFIRIVPVGELSPVRLIGERVRFTNRLWGVVGVEGNKAPKDITFADLYVDIGAESQADAERRLPIGTAAVIDKGAFELGENRVAGKSLDNRVGCAVIVDVISKLGDCEHNLIVVLASQKEVGSRGIRTAAFNTNADFALSVGTAAAGDMPNAERSNLQLGRGPAIKVMDRGIVVPPAIKQILIDAAKRANIDFQLEISPEGTSDAGQILLTKGGIPTGAVSVPVRYRGTPAQVVDIRDVEQTSRLVLEALKKL
ncbi:M42 family peptidase [Effusibacillus lacus]|uniref:Aminopeptidase n=1 Tax=Effusibacillus lacus TaxID=1348429 RepID=A0A292YML0_9BACL|nr:M42 family peptidase [Effusibacillus lacus]TCS75298.1 endoglucanase [Effusibacillus lacus]GAX89735.1 aminopeptidase [Effusibacillus lacus]